MRSLRSQLVLVIGAVALVAVFLAAVVVAVTTDDAINDVVEARRVARTAIENDVTSQSLLVATWSDMQPLVLELAEEFDADIVIADLDGRTLVSSTDGSLPPLVGVIDPFTSFGPDQPVEAFSDDAYNDALIACFEDSGLPYVTDQDGFAISRELEPFTPMVEGCFEIASQVAFEDNAIGLESSALLFVGFASNPVIPWPTVLLVAALVVAIAGVAAFFVSRTLVTPISDLALAARSIHKGDLSTRVETSGPTEVEELAESFNEMAGALENADTQRRQLTADVAHELRSPVTNIIGYLDAIEDGVIEASPDEYGVVKAEAIRLGGLIGDLQLLASLDESTLSLKPTPSDLRAVVDAAARVRLPRAAEKNVSITVEGENEVIVTLDPERFEQVIGNLLDNAIEHTPKGGWVKVEAATDANTATVTVTDSGEGIDPDLLPAIFDRLRRGDEARTPGTEGRGLGLAVGRGITRAHGGDITAENTSDDGARFVVTIPIVTRQSG